MKQVVIHILALVWLQVLRLLVIGSKKHVAELWYVVEELEHRIHIADRTQIFQANVTEHTATLALWDVREALWRANQVHQGSQKLQKIYTLPAYLLNERSQHCWRRVTKHSQCLVGLCTTLLCLALVERVTIVIRVEISCNINLGWLLSRLEKTIAKELLKKATLESDSFDVLGAVLNHRLDEHKQPYECLVLKNRVALFL